MHPEPLSPEAVAHLAAHLTEHWQTPEQYVASLFTAVMQLLYYASLVAGIGRRRD